MNLKKLWILPLVLVIGLVLYLALSKKSASTKAPEPAQHATQVEARPTLPNTQRIGVSLHTTAWNHDLAEQLKPLRPAWLRNGGETVPTPEYFALTAEVQADPWLTVPTNLSDEELTQWGHLIKELAGPAQFSQVILEFDDGAAEHALPLIAAAAGTDLNFRPVKKELATEEPTESAPLAAALLQAYFRDTSPLLVSHYEAPVTRATVQLLNDVAGGSLHSIPAPEGRTWAAFRTLDTWSAVLVSEEPLEVAVTFPRDSRALPAYALVLTDTTVEKQPVSIADQTVTVHLPAHSTVVLTSDAARVIVSD